MQTLVDDLEDASNELMLADEEEVWPLAIAQSHASWCMYSRIYSLRGDRS